MFKVCGMRISGVRKKKNAHKLQEVHGIARVDTRTKRLVRRLEYGDVAVIDHEDIDRIAAEALIDCKVAAVLNAAKSTSGRYPNLGPGILIEAGIPLIDGLGSQIMSVAEGSELVIRRDGSVTSDGDVVAQGCWQTPETNTANMEEARAGLPLQLKAFASNTMEYVEAEQDLILDGVGVPDVHTRFAGKHALVVVRGYQYKEDLEALRPYIREYRPVIIGVDGGADAVLEAGYKLDMIVGDMDSVSDRALRSGAEIVVHAYRDGRAPGQKRVQDLAVPHVIFPATGMSEDIAMLLADAQGAQMIVAVGTHSTLVEYLDKGRRGMASTFLTRLQVGGKLVDAKGVSQLYRSRISNWQVAFLVCAGAAAIGAAMAATSAGQVTFHLVGVWLSNIFHWFKHILW